jgi:hypothetical protein
LNSDAFKKFVTPLIEEMIENLGGYHHAKQHYDQLPDGFSHFIAGGVFGMVDKLYLRHAPWREVNISSIHVQLDQDEVRRVLDLVRLKFETGSATS